MPAGRDLTLFSQFETSMMQKLMFYRSKSKL
jgi:hypothetical protein